VSSFTSASAGAHHRVYVLRCLCDLGIYMSPGGRAPEAHSANGTPACSVRRSVGKSRSSAALVQYIARHDAMNLIR
jgi:hypothetical protein